MSHTPGPWKPCPRTLGSAAIWIMDSEGNCIADTMNRDHKANAALIAAAPDMLAMLKELAEKLEPPEHYLDRSAERLHERVLSTIALAEGQACLSTGPCHE